MLQQRGASGQLLREHTQNCFFVCSFRASAWATCSYATSTAESRSREIVPQARVECSQQAETRARRKTGTAIMEGCLSKGEIMFNHASGQLLPEHTWNPCCARKCAHIVRMQQCCRMNTFVCAQKEIQVCSRRENAAVFSPEHVSLRTERDPSVLVACERSSVVA